MRIAGQTQWAPFAIIKGGVEKRDSPSLSGQWLLSLYVFWAMGLICLFYRFHLLTALGGQFTFMFLQALWDCTAPGLDIFAKFGNIVFTGLMCLYPASYYFFPVGSSFLPLRFKVFAWG
jgi:hypothetical protein